MKRILLLALLLLPVCIGAQEVVTLTTPIAKTATSCRVSIITIDLDRSAITAQLVYLPTGETGQKMYDAASNPTGATLLHSLNIGNFSGATSLIKAVYNRLASDGVCVGTVSGTPQ